MLMRLTRKINAQQVNKQRIIDFDTPDNRTAATAEKFRMDDSKFMLADNLISKLERPHTQNSRDNKNVLMLAQLLRGINHGCSANAGVMPVLRLLTDIGVQAALHGNIDFVMPTSQNDYVGKIANTDLNLSEIVDYMKYESHLYFTIMKEKHQKLVHVMTTRQVSVGADLGVQQRLMATEDDGYSIISTIINTHRDTRSHTVATLRQLLSGCATRLGSGNITKTAGMPCKKLSLQQSNYTSTVLRGALSSTLSLSCCAMTLRMLASGRRSLVNSLSQLRMTSWNLCLRCNLCYRLSSGLPMHP